MYNFKQLQKWKRTKFDFSKTKFNNSLSRQRFFTGIEEFNIAPSVTRLGGDFLHFG